MCAPESRSWSWKNLSCLITKHCTVYGDFNIDLEQDGSKADYLLSWADSQNLAPYLPDTATSRRAERIIDFAFSNLASVEVQTYIGNTTSDHRPILSVRPPLVEKTTHGRLAHWNVFTLFTEFTFNFWENLWQSDGSNGHYPEYLRFLTLLEGRCTVSFSLDVVSPDAYTRP